MDPAERRSSEKRSGPGEKLLCVSVLAPAGGRMAKRLLSALRWLTKWIQRSHELARDDKKIQGGQVERGAEGCQISSKEHDGDIISNVGKCRREGGRA